MGYDHSRIKSNARLFYGSNMGSSILAGLFRIIAVIVVLIVLLALGYGVSFVTMFIAEEISSLDVNSIKAAVFVLYMLLNIAVWIAAMLSIMLVNMGIMNWFRQSIYGKVSLDIVFIPFKKDRLLSNCAACLLMCLYIFLWSLLLVVPGLIKSFSYSQVLFIKAEYPNIPAKRALELSSDIMDGHKADLLYLHLSFIGWFFLSAITQNILGIIYVIPYFSAALTFAYEEIKADAIARGIFRVPEPEYV